jgi:hypothetical protein
VDALTEEGWLAGVPVALDGGIAVDPAAGGSPGLLVSVTERRTRAQIDAFVAAFEKVVR